MPALFISLVYLGWQKKAHLYLRGGCRRGIALKEEPGIGQNSKANGYLEDFSERDPFREGIGQDFAHYVLQKAQWKGFWEMAQNRGSTERWGLDVGDGRGWEEWEIWGCQRRLHSQDEGHNEISPGALQIMHPGRPGSCRVARMPGEERFYYLENFQSKNILWDWSSADSSSQMVPGLVLTVSIHFLI